MSAVTEKWSQDFGDSYTKRNRVNWRSRIPFWADVLDLTGARSVYEVGTNSGFNLTAIKHVNPLVQVYGCEVNDTAATQAERAGFRIARGAGAECLSLAANEYDLVCSVGCLIHVPTSDLMATMQAMTRASAEYVLAVEYASQSDEEEVLYRGQAGMLWRRPFGKLYGDLGLTLIREWDAGEGFDNCRAWLLKRPV